MQNTHNVLIVFCFHTLFSSLLLFCCSNNLLYTQQSGIKASCLKQFKNVKWIFIFVENGRMSVKNTTQLSVCIRHRFYQRRKLAVAILLQSTNSYRLFRYMAAIAKQF